MSPETVWTLMKITSSSLLASPVASRSMFVSMNSAALFGIDEENAGVASALVNTTQQVGAALGTAFLNTIAASATVSYLATRINTPSVVRAGAVHGYTTAFEVSALLAAVVAGLLVGAKRNHTNVDEDVSVMSETMDSEFAME